MGHAAKMSQTLCYIFAPFPLLLHSTESSPPLAVDVTWKGECDKERIGDVSWDDLKRDMWESVESRDINTAFLDKLSMIYGKTSSCTVGIATLFAISSVHALRVGALDVADAQRNYVGPFELGGSIAQVVVSGFPLFGALDWLAVESQGPSLATQSAIGGCGDAPSAEFRLLVKHSMKVNSPIPSLAALEYLGVASAKGTCETGQAAAVLAFAITHTAGLQYSHESLRLVEQADRLLTRSRELAPDSLLRGWLDEWPLWALLNQVSRLANPDQVSPERRAVPFPSSLPAGGCILMVYAFPTMEIRNDTVRALRLLEENYFAALGVRYPVVIFTDPLTGSTLVDDLGGLVSAPLVPAIIPAEEMTRPMSSYSCLQGTLCESGGEMPAGADEFHRGVFDDKQFWSADYLRISRYSAGPLFEHYALDNCGAFLKVDTDFFLTVPLDTDPIEEIRREGGQLAYWQIHVQGQRQEGYMDAAVKYLRETGLKVRNRAFYARGAFEEKAERLNISLDDVPEALQSATVIYGCLFGGDVRFFRSPRYRSFFAYMDSQKGFETKGWSNQFLLGTAAASLLYGPQVRRLYVSGMHQECEINVSNGTVRQSLSGSSSSLFR